MWKFRLPHLCQAGLMAYATFNQYQSLQVDLDTRLVLYFRLRIDHPQYVTFPLFLWKRGPHTLLTRPFGLSRNGMNYTCPAHHASTLHPVVAAEVWSHSAVEHVAHRTVLRYNECAYS